ncbi:pentapeptide repeat-containing protein [Cysteiniphilum litorale]|uniref:pentapeptide repeat-containing protein n=1 Tax=Cysteiniphilum litorale TaxID=2056700 RepID=UPI003F881EE0
MKKIILYAAIISIAFSQIGQANLKYNPSQYSQFQNTGSCPKCDLTGITNFYVNGNVDAPYDLEGANISESFLGSMHNFSGSNFQGVTACKTKFSTNDPLIWTYSKSNFSNAILIESVFHNADLSYTNFNGANVRDVDFSNANLYGATGINFTEVKSVCDAIMPDGSKGKCN